MSDAGELARRIIEINRAKRLGETTMEEWTDRITALLRAQPDVSEPIEVSKVRAPEGGAGSSSGTLFFHAKVGTAGGVVEKDYVLRFRPAEQLFHQYDLDGQVRIQRALHDTDVPVPQQCWEDIPGTFLTMPGYIMERAAGEAAPGAWFASGVIADAEPAQRRAMVMSFFKTMVNIHAVDWRARGLSFLLNRAQSDSLVGREINWYHDGLEWAGEQEAIAKYDYIRQWLLENVPPYEKAVLCHGDSNFTNTMFADNAISAVLDWEMSFIGTPECDLSYAILGMGALTSDYPEGTPSEDEMLAEYTRYSGHTPKHMDYYRLFSLYRIVYTHILGVRAFPDDFKAAFKGHVDGLIAKMEKQAEVVGASARSKAAS